MKKKYVQPVNVTQAISMEYHLMEPSTWQVDDGPKIPIGEGEGDPDAKGYGFTEDFSEDIWEE